MAVSKRNLSLRKLCWKPSVIFCTVGNDHHRFTRFENLVNDLASKKHPNQKIIFQHGHSNPVIKSNIINVDFLERTKFDCYLREADAVYCHSGAGTLLSCVEFGVVPKVMCRKLKYSEHINDHQQEIFDQFLSNGLITDVFGSFVSCNNAKKNLRTGTRLENEICDLIRGFLL